jgi:uncharacterized membrane protein (UPF0136 family)
MRCIGRWFLGFGLFLFACGLAGYLSNPAAAKTALISGSVFGFLSAAWGGLMLAGYRWARTAAAFTTGFLAMVFVWRSSASWLAVANGQPKAFAATLITLMLCGALASLWALWRFRQQPQVG